MQLEGIAILWPSKAVPWMKINMSAIFADLPQHDVTFGLQPEDIFVVLDLSGCPKWSTIATWSQYIHLYICPLWTKFYFILRQWCNKNYAVNCVCTRWLLYIIKYSKTSIFCYFWAIIEIRSLSQTYHDLCCPFMRTKLFYSFLEVTSVTFSIKFNWK